MPILPRGRLTGQLSRAGEGLIAEIEPANLVGLRAPACASVTGWFRLKGSSLNWAVADRPVPAIQRAPSERPEPVPVFSHEARRASVEQVSQLISTGRSAIGVRDLP